MYYDPRINDHGLPHNPFLATVVPRPIGWISSLSPDGILNLAPYSCFNAVATEIPFLMFASGGPKDSFRNIEATGEFVANMATYDLREAVNLTSSVVPPDVDEAELAGLEMVPSVMVKPPRVARSPIAHECTYVKTVTLDQLDGQPHPTRIVIGQVVNVYIDDDVLRDGLIDIARVRPLTRLGYMEYSSIDASFTMPRPR
jgi:flavin reductase (DIM6/NTAB) family NADH-FMN oxidoreductase RutF